MNEKLKEKLGKNKKKITISLILFFLIIFILFILLVVLPFALPRIYYYSAEKEVENGNYEKAISLYEKAKPYEDSRKKQKEIKIKYYYKRSIENINNEKYEEAVKDLNEIVDYKDVKDKLKDCGKKLIEKSNFNVAKEAFKNLTDDESKNYALYVDGILAIEKKSYEEAINNLENVKDIDDTKTYIQQAHYLYGKELLENKNYLESLEQFEIVKDYEDSKQYLNQANYLLGKKYMDEENYEDSVEYLKAAGDYEDAKQCLKQVSFNLGKKMYDEKNYLEAAKKLKEVGDYENAKELLNTSYFMVAEENYEKGYLNTAKSYYEKLPKNFKYNKVTAKSRLDSINKYKAFLPYCGKWKATGKNKAYIRQIHPSTGSWDEWWTEVDGYGTFEITCKITSKGVKIEGSADFEIQTEWSSLSQYLKLTTETTNFSKTVKSLPNELSIGNHTKLTLSNKKPKINYTYTDKAYSLYFNYRYKSNWKYNKRVEKY